MQWLDLYSDSIKRLCVKHNVKELYAFGSVLGTDINVTKTHPTTPPNRFSTHAEIGAMKACSDPSGTTLYIARLKLDGSTAIARPCSWCMQQIQNNEVYRVVYTTDFDMPESFYISTVDWNSSVLEA